MNARWRVSTPPPSGSRARTTRSRRPRWGWRLPRADPATTVSLPLPFADGDFVGVTVYGADGTRQREDRGIPSAGPYTTMLERFDLLVVEPAR